MSITIILSFVSLFHYIAGFHMTELPSATLGTPLAPRQLVAGCGLDLNVWGQVSPTKSSGYANLCLQCRVNVLGISVGFNFHNALSSSISTHGVSASDCTILQNYIANDLLKISAKAKTSASCTAACSKDARCGSCTFTGGSCRMNAVNYINQNHAGGPLAEAFQGLFSQGGSQYCSLCPNDRGCGPAATGLPRRSLDAKKAKRTKCPSGLTACPLSRTSDFTTSTPFECLDVTEELSSCGGCATLGQGVNCSTLRGVASSGCSQGKCKIFSCKSGYKYSETHNTCYKPQHKNSKTHA